MSLAMRWSFRSCFHSMLVSFILRTGCRRTEYVVSPPSCPSTDRSLLAGAVRPYLVRVSLISTTWVHWLRSPESSGRARTLEARQSGHQQLSTGRVDYGWPPYPQFHASVMRPGRRRRWQHGAAGSSWVCARSRVGACTSRPGADASVEPSAGRSGADRLASLGDSLAKSSPHHVKNVAHSALAPKFSLWGKSFLGASHVLPRVASLWGLRLVARRVRTDVRVRGDRAGMGVWLQGQASCFTPGAPSEFVRHRMTLLPYEVASLKCPGW